jgi:hypothetical protein
MTKTSKKPMAKMPLQNGTIIRRVVEAIAVAVAQRLTDQRPAMQIKSGARGERSESPSLNQPKNSHTNP